MEYPKPIMKLRELTDMGFPEEYLLRAYRHPGQRFAGKVNPSKRNSPIIIDTQAFEKYRIKQIETENKSLPERRVV